MFKKVWISLILVPLFNFGQNNLTIDENKKVWLNEFIADTIRLEAVDAIVRRGFLFKNTDSALVYAKNQLNFAIRKGYKKYEGKALNSLGNIHYLKGDYSQAIHYHEVFLEKYGFGEDFLGTTSALNGIGVVQYENGDYGEAMKTYTQCLKICSEYTDSMRISGTLNNIGALYKAQKNYSDALRYFKKSLNFSRGLSDINVMISSLNNIGLIYFSLNQYIKAEKYFLRTLRLSKRTNTSTEVAAILNNLGLTYCKLDKLLIAEKAHNEALEIGKRNNDVKIIIQSKTYLGELFRIMGNSEFSNGSRTKSKKLYLNAITEGMAAYNLAKSLNNPLLIKDAAKVLSDSYKLIGNDQEALNFYEVYINYRDVVEDIAEQRSVLQQAFYAKYLDSKTKDSLALEKKNLQLQKKQKDRQNYFYLIGLVFLILLGSSLIIYKRRVNVIIRNSRTEKENMLTEISKIKQDYIDLMEKKKSFEIISSLNKSKIESFIEVELNQTDWGILRALHTSPEMSNKEIAEKICLSVSGVRSSLQKMYRYFNIPSSRNQRIALLIKAIRVSQDS